MPVDLGELRTRWGVSETKRVPRRRSSRTMGGGADGRMGGNSGSCAPGFGVMAPPPICPSAHLLLATTCPATVRTHQATRLWDELRAAIRTRRGFGRGLPGLPYDHTPRI